MDPIRRHTSGITTLPVQIAVRITLVLLSLCAGVIVTAGPVSAHAELASSAPASGSSFSRCPQTVALAFDEAVANGGLTVTINGKPTATHPTSDDNQHFVVKDGTCESGPVSVIWRTVSADDGHVATGSLRFRRVGTPVGAAATQRTAIMPSAPLGGATTVLAVARGVGYACLAIFGGGLLFLTFLWPGGARLRRVRVLIIGAAVGGIAAAVGALWSTLDNTGMTLTWALRLPFGREYAALALLWMLAGVVVVDFLQRRELVVARTAWRLSVLLLFAGIAAVEAMSAHAYASDERVLGMMADLTHLSAMSVWIGGLTMLSLAAIPRLRGADLSRIVERFSAWAQVAVASVVVSGLGLAFVVIAPLPRFWGTHYAGVLAVKLSVLGLALVAAFGSRIWVKRLRGGRPVDGIALIATSVGIETLCAVAVLIAAGTLVTSSPGV